MSFKRRRSRSRVRRQRQPVRSKRELFHRLAFERLEDRWLLSGGSLDTLSIQPQSLPTAQQPTLNVNGNSNDGSGINNVEADGKEGRSVVVPIVADLGPNASPDAVMTINVTGIDSSWGSFSAPIGVYDPVHGTWTVTLAPGQDLSTGLTFIPAPFSDIDLTGVQVDVTAFEPETNTSATTNSDLTVAIDAVANVPTISASNISGNANAPIAVTLVGGLTDTDGSESITGYKISGVPTGYSFNQGTNNNDGSWSFTPTDASGGRRGPLSARLA